MSDTRDIALEQWRLHTASYYMDIADIRDEIAYTYGHVPGEVYISLEQLMAGPPAVSGVETAQQIPL